MTHLNSRETRSVQRFQPLYPGAVKIGSLGQKVVGRNIHAAFEYQIDPRLFFGGRMELERAPDYTPNRAMFYLRYNLDRAAAQPVRLPPEPVQPYSQF